jgi:hypothetical protein
MHQSVALHPAVEVFTPRWPSLASRSGSLWSSWVSSLQPQLPTCCQLAVHLGPNPPKEQSDPLKPMHFKELVHDKLGSEVDKLKMLR